MTDIARISGPNLNADLLALITIRANELQWSGTAAAGVEEKLFERINEGACARETALVRLAPRTSIPEQRTECRVDIYVLEGAVDVPGQSCSAGHFVRIPPDDSVALRSDGGATLLVKKRGGGADGTPITIDTADRANWAPWGGRGSEKAQIYDPGALPEAAWVGFMLPDLTIPEHDHAGGEEIFILEGELRDERGLYGPGTWVRFPIGVTHSPTSLGEGCKMLVREGDAHPIA